MTPEQLKSANDVELQYRLRHNLLEDARSIALGNMSEYLMRANTGYITDAVVAMIEAAIKKTEQDLTAALKTI